MAPGPVLQLPTVLIRLPPKQRVAVTAFIVQFDGPSPAAADWCIEAAVMPGTMCDLTLSEEEVARLVGVALTSCHLISELVAIGWVPA